MGRHHSQLSTNTNKMTWAQVYYNLMASGLIHIHNTNSFDIELTMMFAEFYQPGKLAKLEKWSLHVI